jgi:hypothetical protein
MYPVYVSFGDHKILVERVPTEKQAKRKCAILNRQFGAFADNGAVKRARRLRELDTASLAA